MTRPTRTLRAISTWAHVALILATVTLGFSSSGCSRWFGKQSLGSSEQALGTDGGTDMAGVVTFTVSPSSQDVTVYPPDAGRPQDFCTQSFFALTATLYNGTANSIYISNISTGNIALGYFKLNGTDLTSTSRMADYMEPLSLTLLANTVIVAPGNSTTFSIYSLCPQNPTTGRLNKYTYAGPGYYTFTVTYNYTGADVPTDMGVSTFHGSVTSSEVTIHAL